TLFGAQPDCVSRVEAGILTTLPMAILIVLMLVMGTHIPKPFRRLLEYAAPIVLTHRALPGTELTTLDYRWPVGVDTTSTSSTAK
ncbi:hydrogenase 4 subunit F, partial [Morganella morganii]|nr:hydrogenase 4 subunit F [Morganella morganii]